MHLTSFVWFDDQERTSKIIVFNQIMQNYYFLTTCIDQILNISSRCREIFLDRSPTYFCANLKVKHCSSGCRVLLRLKRHEVVYNIHLFRCLMEIRHTKMSWKIRYKLLMYINSFGLKILHYLFQPFICWNSWLNMRGLHGIDPEHQSTITVGHVSINILTILLFNVRFSPRLLG